MLTLLPPTTWPSSLGTASASTLSVRRLRCGGEAACAFGCGLGCTVLCVGVWGLPLVGRRTAGSMGSITHHQCATSINVGCVSASCCTRLLHQAASYAQARAPTTPRAQSRHPTCMDRALRHQATASLLLRCYAADLTRCRRDGRQRRCACALSMSGVDGANRSCSSSGAARERRRTIAACCSSVHGYDAR